MDIKRFFNPANIFVPMLLIGLSLCTVSCSDDDDDNGGNTVTINEVYGNYTGKMQTLTVVQNSEGETADDGETTEGADVTASIDANSVVITDFPIKDIVLSIVGDETVADGIVEAVGQVDYRMAYTAALSAAKDSISMDLKPETLKLDITIPSSDGGEDAKLSVNVKVEVETTGKYSVETGDLKFNITATEVKLGEGDNQTALPTFSPTTFKFDLDKDAVTHHLY